MCYITASMHYAVVLLVVLQSGVSFRRSTPSKLPNFALRMADEIDDDEPIFSLSYDPLENPNQLTFERDLEDLLIERGNRFYDETLVRINEKCYLVGLDDKSRWVTKKSKTETTEGEGKDEDEDEDEEDIMAILDDLNDLNEEEYEEVDEDEDREYLTNDLSMIDDVDKTTLSTETSAPLKISRQKAFSMEESLAELSELAGAAGLTVVGSTYQRVQKPNIQYYIGAGKTKDIYQKMQKLKCCCVIFDAELTPSQQKNLEMSFNDALSSSNKKKSKKDVIKVVDRTALILDIFAQHAKTKEGQLQVRLALLTYRLPRLTNLWSHLERQSAGSKGASSGGVGLRGPGEKQLESDKREMKAKISALNKAIDTVRMHRSVHRSRRRRLGLPVVALVGYTNSGKSTLLNKLINSAEVYTADMLFATLDPTTRLVRMAGLNSPDLLFTDTVGFIQKLPTHLIAAFRATLEELNEADVLMHITDISNDEWRKQEASVLSELHKMGLSDKPVITVWNKVDKVPERKEYLKMEARKRGNTLSVSAKTGDGLDQIGNVLEAALSSQMEPLTCHLPYGSETSAMIDRLHRVSVVDEVRYGDYTVYIRAAAPVYLQRRMIAWSVDPDTYSYDDYHDEQRVYNLQQWEIEREEREKGEMMEEAEKEAYTGEEGEAYTEEESVGVTYGITDTIEEHTIDVAESTNSVSPIPPMSSIPYRDRGMGGDKEEKEEKRRKSSGAKVLINRAQTEEDIDWKQLAKGRHSAKKAYLQ